MSTTSTHHLTDIANLLVNLGVTVTKVGTREIIGNCPVHRHVTGHDDRSPSWSMNSESGLWICFSCGSRGTLPYLVDIISGGTVDSLGIQRLLIDNGMNRLLSPKEQDQEEAPIDPQDFLSFKRVSDSRCASKNLDPDTVFTYGVRWNPNNKSWSIPIIHSTGQLQGWQEKKKGWVRNYPIGVKKSKTLFGIERFRSKTAILLESPLDVVRFAGVFSRPQALASFGAFVSDEQMRLLTHVADTVIIAMDNDKAGFDANKQIYNRMTFPRKGIRWWNYSETIAKDIGDMSDEEIEHGMLTATIIPPWISNV